MEKKTVRDIDVKNKTVIVRAPLNVPIEDGQVKDQLRLESALPTLKYLLEQGCRLVLLSHHSHEGQSLAPVAPVLSKLLGREVQFLPDCAGPEIETKIKAMKQGEVAVCENVRFHPEEEKNDPEFARQLAALGDIFVEDDFTVVHRAHASVSGIAKFLPAVAGLQVEREVTTIVQAMRNPARPLVAIIGGAKIETKMAVLEAFLKQADTLIIGGAMANNFFKEKGLSIGKSHYDPKENTLVKQILAKAKSSNCHLYIPEDDVMVGQTTEKDEKAVARGVSEVKGDEIILDFGPQAMAKIDALVKPAKTIIWNGPLGMVELPAFRKGTLALAHSIIASSATSIVGGGDTDGFINQEGLHDKFSFVSTGGGASLDLMAGKELPGLIALQDK